MVLWCSRVSGRALRKFSQEYCDLLNAQGVHRILWLTYAEGAHGGSMANWWWCVFRGLGRRPIASVRALCAPRSSMPELRRSGQRSQCRLQSWLGAAMLYPWQWRVHHSFVACMVCLVAVLETSCHTKKCRDWIFYPLAILHDREYPERGRGMG